MEVKIFEILNLINSRLSNIEKNLARIDEKLEYSIALHRNHLIRIKNNENISDEMILLGNPYNDLSPERALAIYNNQELDFIVLDVTPEGYVPPVRLQGALKIPFKDLESRFSEIYSKTTPILVISEDGIQSILAAEFLVTKGFFNINNVSGGYKFWPKSDDHHGSKGHLETPSAANLEVIK